MKKLVSYLVVLVISLFTFVGVSNALETSDLVTQSSGAVVPDGKALIYIGRDGCQWCQRFVPGLKNLSKWYNFEYKYVNTDTITEEEYNEWLKIFGIDPADFGTPTFGVFENKKLVAKNGGWMPEDELFNFLQENGIIGENEKYEPKYKYLKVISSDEYNDLVKSNKKAMIVFSQNTSVEGLNSKSLLDDLAKEYGIDIYYYELKFETQEDLDKFVKTNKYIEKNIDSFTIPTVMIIKGKEMIDINAVLTEDVLRPFIEENMKLDFKIVVIVFLSILLIASAIFNVLLLKNKKCK